MVVVRGDRRRYVSHVLDGTRGRNLKFTGLTQKIWANSKALIWIFSQTAGSTCNLWVNPVNFTSGLVKSDPPPRAEGCPVAAARSWRVGSRARGAAMGTLAAWLGSFGAGEAAAS